MSQRNDPHRSSEWLFSYSETEPCPYIEGEQARMPLLFPVRRPSATQWDRQLELGRRRSGYLLYYTDCPACRACQPTRLDVDLFVPTRSMRRVWARGESQLQVRVGPPQVDAERLELFNRHRHERGLAGDRHRYSADDLHSFLVDSCVETVELAIYHHQRLIGCGIVDCGRESLSAVYTYFDPDARRWSVGTYAILKQWQLARETGRRWLYLGMLVESNPHLNYKAKFLPQQRLVDGQWRWFPELLPESSRVDASQRSAHSPGPRKAIPGVASDLGQPKVIESPHSDHEQSTASRSGGQGSGNVGPVGDHGRQQAREDADQDQPRDNP
jgi:leucyl-tRNA---protein transferase